nr:hypothetical protein CFP56_75173 [Quercus suber]
MENRNLSRALSHEEETELARSTKKIKDGHHASFQEGQDRPTSSFKDKLKGEIPGAFIQAFDFSETMDEDEESDDKLATIRDGFVAVSLSKSTKKRIRAPWSKAVIVKVYGRLNNLPIEYYEAEFLNEIGQAIEKVLRIDTHTALGSRGRYARLCVQIDVDKPLPTTVLIGKLEQPILYEGIHKLCFSCSRVGHRKENCPYTIRKPTPPSQERAKDPPSPPPSPHDLHDTDSTVTDKNPTENVQDSTYGPWLVVTRRKSGHKETKPQQYHSELKGPPLDLHRLGHNRTGSSMAHESKRKLSSDHAPDRPNVTKSLETDSKRPVNSMSPTSSKEAFRYTSRPDPSPKGKKANSRAVQKMDVISKGVNLSEDVEVHSPSNEGEDESGYLTKLVEVPSHRQAEAGKGVVSELKLHTSGSFDSDAVKGNPAGTILEKKDARELTGHSPSFGILPLNQDKPSLPSLGVKPVLVLKRIKDGCAGELADPGTSEKAARRDGEEGKMEFEGASDGSISN